MAFSAVCRAKEPPAALFFKDAIANQPEGTGCFVQVSDRYQSLIDSQLAKSAAICAIEIAFNGSSSESLIHPATATTYASVHVQQHSKAASLGSTDCEPMEKH